MTVISDQGWADIIVKKARELPDGEAQKYVLERLIATKKDANKLHDRTCEALEQKGYRRGYDAAVKRSIRALKQMLQD